MARFVWETRAGDDPRGKSRVYFTCHPEDFAIYYPQIRKDFFGLKDCALCHRESFLEPLAPEDLMAGLDQMELMVVPVTKKLLTEPNRAMDQDIAFAKEQNIPYHHVGNRDFPKLSLASHVTFCSCDFLGKLLECLGGPLLG